MGLLAAGGLCMFRTEAQVTKIFQAAGATSGEGYDLGSTLASNLLGGLDHVG